METLKTTGSLLMVFDICYVFMHYWHKLAGAIGRCLHVSNLVMWIYSKVKGVLQMIKR